MCYMCVLQRLILANLNLVRTMEFALLRAEDLIATVGGVSLEPDARVSFGLS